LASSTREHQSPDWLPPIRNADLLIGFQQSDPTSPPFPSWQPIEPIRRSAFPIQTEISLLQKTVGEGTFIETIWPGMAHWISHLHRGIMEVGARYPFMRYGTDWLAFAHIIIAIFFLGVLRDPVRNIWAIQAGMIACVLVIPLAMVCGPIRGIPFYWRLIDCSFGVFGILPLWIVYGWIRRIEASAPQPAQAAEPPHPA
jgi:hypothetical protein